MVMYALGWIIFVKDSKRKNMTVGAAFAMAIRYYAHFLHGNHMDDKWPPYFRHDSEISVDNWRKRLKSFTGKLQY